MESLPSGDFRSISACVGLPGHNGQVGFQNLPQAQPSRSCLPSRTLLCLSLLLGMTVGKHCHRVCRTQWQTRRWRSLVEESGWFLVKTAKTNTEKRYQLNPSVNDLAASVKTNHRYLSICQLMTSGSR